MSKAFKSYVCQRSKVGDVDFNVCESASKMICRLPRTNVPNKFHELIVSVQGSMCEVLKNKLPPQQRQQALQLLTGLIQIR